MFLDVLILLVKPTSGLGQLYFIKELRILLMKNVTKLK